MNDFISKTQVDAVGINKFINCLEEIFAGLRKCHVDDSVCRLCKYDGAYTEQYGECPGFYRDDCFKLSDEYRKQWIDTIINSLFSARPEPLTDAEQRIFLSALSREKEACKKIDEEYSGELNLIDVCNEIERKVKGTLWI